MNEERDIKVNRILSIYSKLIYGEIVNKKEMSKKFNVTEKTIQRDINDIKNYFFDNREQLGEKDIIYKRDKKGYSISTTEDVLKREDILAIMKILLESRAFCKDELKHLTTSILGQVSLNQRKNIEKLVSNELLNYTPVKESQPLLYKMWELSEAIREKEIIEIIYIRADNKEVTRSVKPLAIIFSEYYFYLICYMGNYESPVIYRMDRIKQYKLAGEKFYIKDSDRFKDGEFRKRIQFMYLGDLMKVRFEFKDGSINAVLDRLPTSKIIEERDGKFLIETEVYGNGIVMWILSQGSKIKVLSPQKLVDEIKEEIEKMHKNYK